MFQRHTLGGGSGRGNSNRGIPATDSLDVELGSLLGPTLTSRVSDVYFPELMDEERDKCRSLGLLHPDATRYRLWQMYDCLLSEQHCTSEVPGGSGKCRQM